MQHPTLRFSFPGEGDSAAETPPASTCAATSDPEDASTDVATSGEEAEDEVATSEPPAAWVKGTELAGQACEMAAHWYRLGIADATRHGGLWRTAWEGHGPSLAGISAYARDRAWLPEDHPGGPVTTGIPVLYYRLAAPVAVGAALAWIWVWSRLLRLIVAVLLAGVIALIVLA